MTDKIKIGIIGNGFVGKATSLFSCNRVEILIYDIIPDACLPKGTTISDIDKCDLIFICVPTPLSYTGNCLTNIIEKVLNQLNNPLIVIRSTVPIGYSTKQKCYFMPEFLTELNWKNDFIGNKNWIIGLLNQNNEQDIKFITLITKLIEYAYEENKILYNNIIFCLNEEAEMTKLIKNTFLANKVSFFNEIYNLSQELNIDFNEVCNLISLDERIGKTHMRVPGPPDVRGIIKKGYGGTCLPKDSNSLYSHFEKNNIDSIIIQNTIYRNEYVDRRELDWLNDNGRTLFHTNKTIILVAGNNSRNLCLNLLQNKNNIIIYLDEPDSELQSFENFNYKKISTTKKLFFPKINKVFYKIFENEPINFQEIKNQTLTLYNLIELSELHKSDLIIEGNNFIMNIYKSYNKQ